MPLSLRITCLLVLVLVIGLVAPAAADVRIYITPDNWVNGEYQGGNEPVVVIDGSPWSVCVAQPYMHIGGTGETSTTCVQFPDPLAAPPNRYLLPGTHTARVTIPGTGYKAVTKTFFVRSYMKMVRVNVRMKF